jgi:hypothetical protein
MQATTHPDAKTSDRDQHQNCGQRQSIKDRKRIRSTPSASRDWTTSPVLKIVLRKRRSRALKVSGDRPFWSSAEDLELTK